MKNMKANIVNYYNDEDWSILINKVFFAAEKVLSLNSEFTISIVLTDDDYLQSLNKQFRNKDKPTDVLTFPDGTDGYLGDIFISMERCLEQSIEYGHLFSRELGFLVVHGLLHTLGYDHISKEDEAVMIALQNEILTKANVKREAFI